MTSETKKEVIGYLAALAYFADVALVTYAMAQLIFIMQPVDVRDQLAPVIVMLLVFGFASILLKYSGPQDNQRWLFQGIAWLYTLATCIMLIQIIILFVLRDGGAGTTEWFSTVTVPMIVGMLGVTLGYLSYIRIGYFTFAYIFVALTQAGSWVGRIIMGRPITFDWLFVGNIILFLMLMTIIGVLVALDKTRPDAYEGVRAQKKPEEIGSSRAEGA